MATRKNTLKEQIKIKANVKAGYPRKIYCYCLNTSHNPPFCSVFHKNDPIPSEGTYFDWDYCFYTMRKPRFKFRIV